MEDRTEVIPEPSPVDLCFYPLIET